MSLADSSKEAEQNVSSLNQSMKELSQSKASGKDYYEAFKKAAEVFKQPYDVIDGAISRVAELDCVVNRYVLYYANVKKGCRKNGECIRTT